MFTFLNATILIALAGILIPLILHLLNRQRKRNVPFSTIRFLKLLEKQRLKRLRLYQYLLILVRTLIILFLVLAFARPTFTGQNVIGGGARTTAVIVVDDAVYMRRYDESGNRFHRAVQKARDIRQQFHPEDQVFVISSHAPDRPLEDLSGLECSHARSDWSGVFSQAAKIFSDYPNYNNELYIVSDFEFRGSELPDNVLPESVRIYLFEVGRGSVSNISVDTVQIENSLFEIDNTVRLAAVIRSHDLQSAINAECHLYVNEKRVSHQRVTLEATESKVVNLTFQPRVRGEVKGYVEISDDDLIADNRYYFAFYIPEQIEVLYVDENPSLFWKAAWKAIEINSNIEVTSERYNSWGRFAFNRFNTICLVNPVSLSESMTSRLRQFIDEGNGLIIIPGIRTIPTDFNRICESLKLNIRMQDFLQAQSSSSYFTLIPPSLNHPLFSGLFRMDEPELNKPVFRKYFRYRTTADRVPILSLNNGDPFLIQDRNSVYLFAGSFEEDWTDFQYRGLFIPLFVRLIYLSSALATQRNISGVSGQATLLSFEQVTRNQFALLEPDGTKNRVAPISFDPQLTFLLNRLNAPGHYSLLSGDQSMQTISVNIPAREIVPQKVDMHRIFTGARIFSEEELYSDAVQQARVGLELWKWALVLVILLVLAELLLIKKTEGKN